VTVPLAYPLYEVGGWVGNATDDFGVDWVVTREDGWSTTPPPRTFREDRAGRDGAYAARNRLGTRLITLEGTAIAPSQLAMLAAKDRFAALAVDSDVDEGPHLLTVTESHMERVTWVRREDVGKAADRGPLVFEFGLVLAAPDPLRYSSELHAAHAELPEAGETSGRVYPRVYPLTYAVGAGDPSDLMVTNVGTYPTPALVVFSGPVTDPSIEHVESGRTLTFDIAVAQGDTLDVDLDAHTVLLNGTAGRRNTLVAGSAWFQLYPGTNTLRYRGQQTVPAGGGVPVAAMDVSWRDAWK
jgi:Phage tail protein